MILVQMDILNSGDGDLQIYHDTSHSYIVDQGTGELRLRSNLFNLQSADGSETMIAASENSNVNLYYDNDVKLTTLANGIGIGTDQTEPSTTPENFDVRLSVLGDIVAKGG